MILVRLTCFLIFDHQDDIDVQIQLIYCTTYIFHILVQCNFRSTRLPNPPLFKTLVCVMHYSWNIRAILVQHAMRSRTKGRAAFSEKWKCHLTLKRSIIHSREVLIPGNYSNYVNLVVNYEVNDAF